MSERSRLLNELKEAIDDASKSESERNKERRTNSMRLFISAIKLNRDLEAVRVRVKNFEHTEQNKPDW